MARQILNTNAFLLQWLMEYSSVAVAVPVFSDGMVVGSYPAQGAQCKADFLADSGASGVLAASGAEEFGAELGSGRADVVMESGVVDPVADGGGDVWAEPASREADVTMERGGFSGDGFFCNGCWEPLPSQCWCGSLACCVQCAAGGVWAEPSNHKANVVFMGVDGEAEHGEGTGEVTMDMVRLELQRMAANVERVFSSGIGLGGLGDMVTEMHGRLDEVREQMVTRDTYDRLLDRLRQLESGVEAAEGVADEEQAFEGDVFDEHSGYTDNEGDVSDYGYFDRDGNEIPSEDEHAEFES